MLGHRFQCLVNAVIPSGVEPSEAALTDIEEAYFDFIYSHIFSTLRHDTVPGRWIGICIYPVIIFGKIWQRNFRRYFTFSVKAVDQIPLKLLKVDVKVVHDSGDLP